LINVIDNINSTNAWLSEFNLHFFDSIIALEQSEGRGRQGRFWESFKGGFYYSLVLPKKNLLPIIVGISVAEILHENRIIAKVKWPNDILVEGKKLGGVLCQVQGEKVITGLGINMTNSSSLEKSISLSTLGLSIDKIDFINKFNEKIRSAIEHSDEHIIQQFLIYDCLIGKRVYWKDGNGQVVKISKDGRLVVRDTLNDLIFLTEEVHLL
tara:strand:+ start:1854 stop:2486 length:633 start_codon:yes stop_codon:yes gene_type:complete